MDRSYWSQWPNRTNRLDWFCRNYWSYRIHWLYRIGRSCGLSRHGRGNRSHRTCRRNGRDGIHGLDGRHRIYGLDRRNWTRGPPRRFRPSRRYWRNRVTRSSRHGNQHRCNWPHWPNR